ncbi:MAG: hypothetical protein QOI64_1341 [Solirubrobacteraceae bacterium]|jgi:uncharacterized cupredoxin-like copper-binding protein|nr:hypothetical protein [Solirubrobacteraceae bacterium]
MRAGLLPIAVVSLAATGCGEQRGDATRTVPEPVGTVVAPDPRAVAGPPVSLVDYAVQAREPRVGRAGVIAFEVTNDGTVRHALALDAPAGQVRTRALRPGERALLSVRLPPGTYKWYCPLADHEERGMTGRLRVAE